MKSDTDLERAASWRARDRISHAVHGLPAGVVDGPDGAAPTACREMMEGLEEFERLCTRLGLDDHINFIEGCRWHFEHSSHYRGRRAHLGGYDDDTRDRNGPVRVADPPAPPRWLHRPD